MSLYSGLFNNRPKQQRENNRNKGDQDRYLQVKISAKDLRCEVSLLKQLQQLA